MNPLAAVLEALGTGGLAGSQAHSETEQRKMQQIKDAIYEQIALEQLALSQEREGRLQQGQEWKQASQLAGDLSDSPHVMGTPSQPKYGSPDWLSNLHTMQQEQQVAAENQRQILKAEEMMEFEEKERIKKDLQLEYDQKAIAAGTKVDPTKPKPGSGETKPTTPTQKKNIEAGASVQADKDIAAVLEEIASGARGGQKKLRDKDTEEVINWILGGGPDKFGSTYDSAKYFSGSKARDSSRASYREKFMGERVADATDTIADQTPAVELSPDEQQILDYYNSIPEGDRKYFNWKKFEEANKDSGLRFDMIKQMVM